MKVAKIVTFLAFIAIVFGSGIQLQVNEASNQYWLAVEPSNDSGATSKIEVQESGSSAWAAMTANAGWGYYTYQSTGNGLAFPLSFRFTDASGAQVVASNVLASVSAGSTVDTGVSFGSSGSATATVPPTAVPSTPNCGGSTPTSKPTSTPTTQPTAAPTTEPTAAPTTASSSSGSNSHGHGSHGSSSSSGSATSAPTTKPTTKPTAAPTTKPTSAPTTKPSTSGSHGSSSSGSSTQAPTTKPTSAPTTKPTTKPSTSGSATAAPTTKPTTKPSTSGSSSSTSGSTSLCGVTANSEEPVQILIPLYVDPGSAWDTVITAAGTGVKIIAIINPNSGPDASGPDSSYKTYMQKFTAAGITMVGYVHTSYGDRSISDVTSDITTYASKYTGLSGIFIDEASASSSEISYYQQVYDAITGNSGYTNVILNPGTQPDQGYLDVSTNIVVFEDTASAWKSNFASWVTCAPSTSEKSGYKYRFSAIAYAESSSSSMATLVSEMSAAGMGMVYVTDGAAGGSTYNTLASYFSTEASDVNSLN